MVTAETALALPALAAVSLLVASLVVALAAQVRCTDAAREGVRAAARGDGDGAARAAALRVAPAHAEAAVRLSGDLVTVQVSARVPVLSALLPALRVDASATAAREDVP